MSQQYNNNKQKKYTQKYRVKWEKEEEFQGWLNPLPKDPSKAYCSVCNVIIKAHLCDLKKHGGAKKHINATKLVRHLRLNLDQDGNYIGGYKPKDHFELPVLDNEDDDSDDESSHRWPSTAVGLLLKHVETYQKDLTDGLRKKKDIWEDIAAAVSADGYATSSQDCSKKFRNMKTRYMHVLEKTSSGEVVNLRIDYFEKLSRILQNDSEFLVGCFEQKKLNVKTEVGEGYVSEEETIMMEESDLDADGDEFEWSKSSIFLMLEFLHEFQGMYSGKEEDNEDEVWQNVTEQMRYKGYYVDENQCKRKWLFLVDKCNEIEASGAPSSSWSLYNRVKDINETVKIPVRSVSRKRPMRIRVKSNRRGRKRKLPDPPPAHDDSDGSEPEDSSPYGRNTSSSSRRRDDEESIALMKNLTETAELWDRMDSIEYRLDQLSDICEINRQTNNVIRQIAREVSIMAEHISPQADPLNDRVTLVVPSSEQHSL